MWKWRAIGFVLLLAAVISPLTANNAFACSAGPAAPGTPEVPAAELARAAIMGSDLVAEVTVIEQAQPSTRDKWCGELLASSCSKDRDDPRCGSAVDRYFELCDFDVAVRVQYGRVWKGAPSGTGDALYIRHGEYPYLIVSPSCQMLAAVKPGHTFVFCGSIDSGGALQGGACAYDELFDRVREQRNILVATAQKSPASPEAQASLAQFLEDWHEYKAALASYEQLRQLAPAQAIGYAGPGRILYAQRRYAEAIPYLEQALDRAKDDVEIKSLLAAAQREVKYCAAMQHNPLLACRKPL